MVNQKSSSPDDGNDELRALLQEAEQALSQTVGDAGDKFNELRERLRTAIDDGHLSLERIKAETIRRAKQADQMVRDNPYYAVGIAAGVGALIGIIVSRSCQHSR